MNRSVTTFRNIKIQGNEYDFEHLRPHQVEITVEDRIHRVEIRYSSHVFSEAITRDTTPDLLYDHNGERRAFCVDRYDQSKLLPSIFNSLKWQSVYHSSRGNYFLVKSLIPLAYHVFFNARIARRIKGISVLINVVSAYTKEREIKFAPSVKFSRLVDLLATGKKLNVGLTCKLEN